MLSELYLLDQSVKFLSSSRCELQDDRNDSYITALKQYVTPQTQLALTILPTNRKDRYDAIKKFCCVDHPGMSPIFLRCILLGNSDFIILGLSVLLKFEFWSHVEYTSSNEQLVSATSLKKLHRILRNLVDI